MWGKQLNDEIEKLLFGPIDTKGATAVKAFSIGDPSAIHEGFQDFFEYLDPESVNCLGRTRPAPTARVFFEIPS
jgi:hypothetical protein